MGMNSGIAWTDHTFNPWWGCVKVSAGCQSCYAENLSEHRFGFKLWGKDAERRLFGDKHWDQPVVWNRQAREAGVRARVFCASMADVFEDRRDLDAPRWRLFRLILDTPWLDWLLLTKRPENINALMPGPAQSLPNVWLGATAENQEQLDRRLPFIAQAPSVVRFLSVEPMLERIRLPPVPGVDWVICGGESSNSPNTDQAARRFDLCWADSLREQCDMRGIMFFMKQTGHNGFDDVVRLRVTGKGANPDEWPEHIRVQEFPTPRVGRAQVNL